MGTILPTRGATLRAWLFDHAFPLWWEAGADHRRGGFHERIGQDGRPTEEPRRIRVQARQIVSYAEAGRLGWSGPWEPAIRHGLAFLEQAYRRPDGFYRTLAHPDGTSADDRADLYDQAFVLLALAHAHERLGRPEALLARAEALLDRLESRLALPDGGFREADGGAVLRANPHMHLLEAMLAWVSFGAPGRFRAQATALVRLAHTRLLDAGSGSIGESFRAGWQPVPGPAGREREPGHQFEWAFLLREAETLLALAPGAVPERLRAFGETRGTTAAGAAMFSVTRDGHVLDGSARLWSQAERLRTSLVFGDRAAAEAADRLIARFLDTAIPGLWFDRMLPDGTIVSEPAPGSTLYHLVSAFAVMVNEPDGPSGERAGADGQHSGEGGRF